MDDPDSKTTVSTAVDYDDVDLGVDGVNFIEEAEDIRQGYARRVDDKARWSFADAKRTVRWRIVRTADGLFHWHWTMRLPGETFWTRGEDTWCGRDHFENDQSFTINQINCVECACR